jgi:hypothetical protein
MGKHGRFISEIQSGKYKVCISGSWSLIGYCQYTYGAVKNRMTDTTITQFKHELNSFFVLVLLNIVFGALVMAFGVQFVVSSVPGRLTGIPPSVGVRALTGAVSLVCFGLGIMWVLSSTRILKGITEIRREYRTYPDPVPAEILTGWIVRLMAHYRENKKRIGWMTIICALGGSAFLALGILNGIQGLSAGNPTTLLLSLIAAGINLTIGCVSLIFCRYFQKYSAAWDLRLKETARTEDTLKKSMGIDRE